MPFSYDPESGALQIAAQQEANAVVPNLPQEEANKQLQMVDSKGQAILVPQSQYNQATATGARLETNAEAQQRDLQEKYGDSGLRAFAEGAGRGATLGVSDLILSQFDKEGLAGRKEANPYASTAGEIAGNIGALAVPGLGVGGLLTKAGETAARVGEAAAGSLGSQIVSRLAGTAAKGVAEGAIFGAGQAVSEAALTNPDHFGEMLYSNIGMGALAGGIGAPVLDLGFAGLGKVASKLGDAAGAVGEQLKPLIPGLTQTVDELGNPLSGTRAAIARKINDAYATIADINPLKKISKEDLVERLNDPETRALLNTPEGAEQINSLSKEAPQILSDFKSNLTSAGSDVKKEIRTYQNLLESNVEDKQVQLAAQLGVVDDTLQKAQSEAQDKLSEVMASKTGQAKGLLIDANKAIQEAADKIGQDATIGNAYRIGLENAYKTAAPEAFDVSRGFAQDLGAIRSVYNEGQELSALRTLKQNVGQMAFDKQLASANMADRNASFIMRDLYKSLDNILKDPEKVGSDFSKIITQADADYSSFAGGRRVLRDITQKPVVQLNGQKTFEPSLQKATKNIINPEQNARLTEVLDKFNDIAANGGADVGTIKSGLQDVLQMKSASAEVKSQIKDFLSSSESKNADSLLNFTKDLTGNFSDAQANLQKLSGINQQLKANPDISKFEKALLIKEQQGTLTADEAKRLSYMKRISETSSSNESKITGQQGSLATTSALIGLGAEHAAGHFGLFAAPASLPFVNPLGYIRILDGMKSAALKLQGEVVQSAVQAVKSTSKQAISSAARIKAIDYQDEKQKLQEAQNSLPQIQDHPIMAYVPPQVVPSLMKVQGNAVNYLQAQLPQPPKGPVSPMGDIYKKWEPTKQQMQDYTEKKAVVDNPMVALKALKDGSLTGNQIQALKAVYPDTYSQVSTAMTQLASKMESKGIPYDRNLVLTKWFGTPTDITTTPDFVMRQQGMYQTSVDPAAQAKQAGLVRPTVGGLKNLDIASRSGTSLTNALTRSSNT